MTPTQRAAMEQALADMVSFESGTCGLYRGEFAESIAALRAVLAEQRSDGAPNSSDERHLRRLLAARVGMPNTYFDDGEAQGCEAGIAIDFMREPVADIDAKLRALNVARAVLAEQSAEQEQEPVSFIEPEADNDCAYAYADGWNACLLARKHTAPHTDMQPLLVRDLAELIGSTVPDVCNALEDMGIEPRRSTNAAVTPDEALAVARRLAQTGKRVPLTDTEIFDLWGNPKNQLSQWKFARAVIAAYDAKNGITGEAK